jgi:hypothetical protein
MTQELSHTHGHPHEHEVEPQYGLPERLPQDESILWQGSPVWTSLARHALHVYKLAAYFAAMIAIRVVTILTDGGTADRALAVAAWLVILSSVALAILTAIAYLSARTTVYTITTKRVVMRVGIVLSTTFNLPFARIASAGLRRQSGNTGDIPLALMGNDRIAYLHLWPHVRRWRFAKPEPMLRGVRNPEHVAEVLTKAWAARVGEAAVVARAGAGLTSAAGSASGHGRVDTSSGDMRAA